MASNPHLMDVLLLSQYYSSGRVNSQEARARLGTQSASFHDRPQALHYVVFLSHVQVVGARPTTVTMTAFTVAKLLLVHLKPTKLSTTGNMAFLLTRKGVAMVRMVVDEGRPQCLGGISGVEDQLYWKTDSA